MAAREKRDQTKEQFWRRVFRQWRHSGLSIRAFCAEHGLAEPSFYAWRRIIGLRDQQIVAPRAGQPADFRKPGDAPGKDAPRFVPVRVIDAAAAAAFEVVLPRGRVVRVQRGFDAATLRQLLAILEEDRPC
jgi:hypothetical protein